MNVPCLDDSTLIVTITDETVYIINYIYIIMELHKIIIIIIIIAKSVDKC